MADTATALEPLGFTEDEVARLLNCKPMQVRRLGLDHYYLSPHRRRGKRYTLDGVKRFLRRQHCPFTNDPEVRTSTTNLKSTIDALEALRTVHPRRKRERSSVKSGKKPDNNSHWSDWTPDDPQ